MTEAILLALWVGTSLFFMCREIKEKNSRESHEFWLSELRECLHGIENEFSMKCSKIVEQIFTLRNISHSVYLSQISDLKNEYTHNIQNKIKSRKGEYFVRTLPGYIVKEYERNISDIAHIYNHLITIYE